MEVKQTTIRRWTKAEIAFVRQNSTKMSVGELAARLVRSEMSVKLYMFRHGISRHQQVKRNLMREMVSIKIDAAYFHPTREFYQAVKISQVKFQQIWQGYRQATNEEMAAVARHLRLTRDELIKFMQSRQLDLFEDL